MFLIVKGEGDVRVCQCSNWLKIKGMSWSTNVPNS